MLLLAFSASLWAAEREADLQSDVKTATGILIGAHGFGSRSERAAEEVQQFGRLVGVWKVDQEIRLRDGSWRKETSPGVWVWKYAAGGFGVQDLWYQSGKRLPSYMKDMDHDYQLTALRVFDPHTSSWKVAWISNSGGGEGGAVFGQFDARETEGSIVMHGMGSQQAGEQRIVFHDFTPRSFRWKSEYSQDRGKTWIEVMRLLAHRIDENEIESQK